MIKKLAIGFLAFALFFTAKAQETKEDIQRKQQQLLQEISDLNSTLSQIKKNKKQSLKKVGRSIRQLFLAAEFSPEMADQITAESSLVRNAMETTWIPCFSAGRIFLPSVVSCV